MTDQVLALVPTYGLWLLVGIVFLSCLAVPVPSSIVMLTSGSFVGSGDLLLVPTFLSAFAAAVAGDQVGYLIGKRGGGPLLARLASTKEQRTLLEKARNWIDARGGPGVFFSRWLVSPLGPYVNFIGGATGLDWARFTFWGVLGELTWVGIYVGLGLTFSDNISAVAELAADFSGMLAAGAVTIVLGWKIRRVLKKSKHAV
jgi:membrane-associated protein